MEKNETQIFGFAVVKIPPNPWKKNFEKENLAPYLSRYDHQNGVRKSFQNKWFSRCLRFSNLKMFVTIKSLIKLNLELFQAFCCLCPVKGLSYNHQTNFGCSLYAYIYIYIYLHFLIYTFLLILIYTCLFILMFSLYYYMNLINFWKYGEYRDFDEIF